MLLHVGALPNVTVDPVTRWLSVTVQFATLNLMSQALDVVPARRIKTMGGAFQDRIAVPDRTRRWKASYPRGFFRWCQAQEERAGGAISGIIFRKWAYFWRCDDVVDGAQKSAELSRLND
jgi:hypothetical protein